MSSNRRLASSLQRSFKASALRVEGQAGFEGAGLVEKATLSASGAMALGSLGLAATASSLATSTATFVFFVPVTTVSWPLFAAAGVSARALALVSPKALAKAERMMRMRYVTHVDKVLHHYLLQETGGKTQSTWVSFRAQIDEAARLRLESAQ